MAVPTERQWSAAPSVFGRRTGLLFSSLVAASLLFNIFDVRRETQQLLRREARALFAKDVAFRSWASRHGGVYVPATKDTPPNPYLAGVQERDVFTPSGKHLTLMNSISVMQQATLEPQDGSGVREHLTSLKLLNPANAADSWERGALAGFSAESDEAAANADIDGQPFFRLMRPLVARRDCLTCHAHQGYREGDIRGGLSISIPLLPYQRSERRTMAAVVTTHGAIWLVGMVGILVLARRERRAAGERDRSTARLAESECRFREQSTYLMKLINSLSHPFLVVDAASRRVLLANDACGLGAKTGTYSCQQALHASDASCAADCCPLEIVRRTKAPATVRHIHGDRRLRERIFDVHGYPVFDRQGNVAEMIEYTIDVTEQVRAEEDLRAKSEIFERVFSTTTTCIAYLDRSFNFIRVNRTFAAADGRTPEYYVGRNHFDLFPNEENREIFQRVVERGVPYTVAAKPFVYAEHPERGVTYWDWTLAPVRDAAGTVEALMLSMVEVTERMRARGELLRLNAELEVRVRERTEMLKQALEDLGRFAYTVSHDLRAPLRVINGFAGILLERESDRLSPEGKGHLDRIMRGSVKMAALIEGVLEYSRASQAPLHRDTVDLDRLAEEVAADLRAAHPATRIVIRPLGTVEADATMVRQVLQNLVGNACKYSAKREQPEVEVGVLVDANGERVYHVRDNGAGFDPAGSSKLFEMFQRLHGEQEFPGYGVGLAIVKRLIVRHGGRIWTEARPDEGATFFFTLAAGGTSSDVSH